jgi:hypothetical protein
VGFNGEPDERGRGRAAAPRKSRFWLFAPFAALALAALAWSAAWFMIRERAEAEIDGWMAAEAVAGRQWSCPERSVGGFPFRVEVTCPQLDLKRGDWSASAGRLRTVAQIYQPNHVIAELAGPFRASDGRTRLEASWRDLRASFRGTPGRFRARLAHGRRSDGADRRSAGRRRRSRRRAAGGACRSHPQRNAGEGAVEVSARATNAVLPCSTP